MVTGSYLGNGQDNRNFTDVGFKPCYLIVFSEANEDAMQRYAGEAFDNSLPFNASDEKTDRIQDFLPNGFQIGKHNTVNESDKLFHYIAWNDSVGRIAQNNYNGNASDNNQINTAGFRPDYLIVTRSKNGSGSVHRPASLSGDNTLIFEPGPMLGDAIQSFLPDGFEIGTNDAVNKNAEKYFYVAFRDISTLDLSLAKSVNNSAPNEGDTLTYQVTVANNGPEDASTVEIHDLLPSGLILLSDSTSHGFYASGTGAWSVGNLLNGGVALLSLSAIVDKGTGGSTIINSAGITGADQADLDGSNDTASAAITVQSSDLSLSKMADNLSPNEGDTVAFTITLINLGPDDATAIEVTDLLPAGLTYLSDSTSQGSYLSGSGLWSVGTVAAADSAALMITAAVSAGTAGSIISNVCSIGSTVEADPDSTNNIASTAVAVQSADLAVTKIVNTPTPIEGDTVTYTITVSNLGPDLATGIKVLDLLPAGVTYVSNTASQGTYAQASGQWIVGPIAGSNSAVLTIEATIDAGMVDSTVINLAVIAACDVADPVAGNNSAAVEMLIVVPVALQDTPGSLYPSTAFTNDPQLALRIGIDNFTKYGTMLNTSSAIRFTDGVETFEAKLGNPTYIPPEARNFVITFLPKAIPAGISAPAAYDLSLLLKGMDDNAISYSDTISTAGRNSIYLDIPRIAVRAAELDVQSVYPGSIDKSLLAVEFSNQYPDSRYLDTLVITNTSLGPGSQFEKDSACSSLHLYNDVDGDELLSAADTLIAVCSFTSGRAVFSIDGNFAIPGEASRFMFITAS
ncbi:MAG: DUF11 domain-containing protein, partial [Candidatus Latescibacterota bacterium]